MKRPRATLLGRAAFLLPMLLASACAAVPSLGANPHPRATMPRRGRLPAPKLRGRWKAGGTPTAIPS